MRRRATNVAAVLSVVLSGLAVELWVVSGFRPTVRGFTSSGRQWELHIGDGRVAVTDKLQTNSDSQAYQEAEQAYQSLAAPSYYVKLAAREAPPDSPKAKAYAELERRLAEEWEKMSALSLKVRHPTRYAATFPAISTVTLSPAAVWTFLFWRRRRQAARARANARRCPVCAYDLRATPYRCPECGKTISKWAA